VWRLVAIAMVPKPNKENYSLPKCYRPIALLECLGKLLEKVIARHLTFDITSLSLVPPNQFGTCLHSSTADTGLCLAHNVETALVLGSICGTLLFDIQGFFDNVNHAQLVALVQALGFPVEIYKWISFLSNISSPTLQQLHLRRL
jgi:hypothetical protein